MKSYSNNLNSDNLTKLSRKAKSSRLEKLILKGVCFNDNFQLTIHFNLFIDAVTCSSLKILKIHMKYTHYLLDSLFLRLDLFKNLEYLGISISENYSFFQNPLKNLIFFLQNKNTLLTKVKIHKYIWDTERMQGEKKLVFSGCKMNPADLMMLAELCEGRIIENVNCVNLSENKGIIDDSLKKILLGLLEV